MPVRPLILSSPVVVRALRGDPADLLVRAGGGQRRRALLSMTRLRLWTQIDDVQHFLR